MLLAQQPPPDAAAAIAGLIGAVWCCGIVLVLGQFIVFILALIQILSRQMPTDSKVLWGCIAWFLPVIGPILWWTIGAKQNPPATPKEPPHNPPEH